MRWVSWSFQGLISFKNHLSHVTQQRPLPEHLFFFHTVVPPEVDGDPFYSQLPKVLFRIQSAESGLSFMAKQRRATPEGVELFFYLKFNDPNSSLYYSLIQNQAVWRESPVYLHYVLCRGQESALLKVPNTSMEMNNGTDLYNWERSKDEIFHSSTNKWRKTKTLENKEAWDVRVHGLS